jgi:hypothetical protein
MNLEYWTTDYNRPRDTTGKPEPKLLLRHDVGVHSGWLPQRSGCVTIKKQRYRVIEVNAIYPELEGLPEPEVNESRGDSIEPEIIKYTLAN